ncbi:piggyBac transposable element-derived protein 4-like [Macrobrachium rosenbergii]|uniref:piggyBac transposable element-derived protein 4-like n=1 Tax=Macrobrachium rosenbergii TaxID=79674 RepID=UPI0034D521C5
MPYKGRLSIKTYNPQKPSKYGIKLYMLCEAKSGDVIDFLTYEGSTSTLKDIVFTLMGPLLDKGYHVFMDNYYNSTELAEELYSHGVLCSGTLRLVRKGAPNFLKTLAHQRVPRNSMHFRRRGNVFIICWQDTRLVTMITSACNAETEEFVHRRRVKRATGTSLETVTMDRPLIIGTYCQYMGGVDLFDQLMKYYSMARKGMKWARKFTFYLLQMAILNA